MADGSKPTDTVYLRDGTACGQDLHEIFARVDVQGSQLLAVHPQPNENAWLLGLAALRQEQHVGMVWARGDKPPVPTYMSRHSGRCGAV